MKQQNDQTIAEMISDIEKYNAQGEYSKMKELVDALKMKSEAENNNEGLCAAYLFDGYLYSYDNQLEIGNKATFKALEYAEKAELEYYQMKAYNSLAANYVQMADYFSSLNYYLKALKIAKNNPSFEYSHIIYNNIGNLFTWIDESKTALHYMHLAFDDLLQSGKHDDYLFESITRNLADAYTGVCGFTEIEALKNKYEHRFSEAGKLELNILYKVTAAKYYAENKQYEKAKTYIKECMEIYQGEDDPVVVYRCFLELLAITIQYSDLVFSKQLDQYISTIYMKTVIPAFSYRYAKLKVQYFETFFPYVFDQKIQAYQLYYKEAEAYNKQFKNTYVQNLMIALELDESKLQADTTQEENEYLQKEIEKDVFTNLLNKVYAQKYTEETMSKTDSKTLQTFMIMDIDLFKLVNDEYGHTFGDEVILETASRLKACVHEDSIVARFGGDEFFIYTTITNGLEQLEGYVQNILAMTQYIHFPSDPNKQQTYSIGVYMDYDCHDFDYAFKQADKALYSAKESGRNRAYMLSDTLENRVIKGK